jgi:Zn-dependent alcohol dehydrogenase
MSRTIKFAKAGGPEVLEFVEVQVPAPGPNEVRIKVKAIGINRAEAMWRVDDYIEPVKFPAGLGSSSASAVSAACTAGMTSVLPARFAMRFSCPPLLSGPQWLLEETARMYRVVIT